MREQFILKANKKFNNKFDYSKVNYQGAKTRVIIICPEHGEFEQSPAKHLTTKFGCQKCAKLNKQTHRKTTAEFIAGATKVHGDRYDYSKSIYTGAEKKLIVTCKVHGDFEVSPVTHLNGHQCAKCMGTYKMTTEEFVQRAEKQFPNRFDYSDTVFKSTKSRVKIRCKQHGSFTTSAGTFLKSVHGCAKCAGLVKLTLAEFKRKAAQVHGDRYDYSKTVCDGSTSKITITCPIHGDFVQTVANHLSGRNCYECGVNSASVKRALTNDEFIEKSKRLFGNDKFGYENTNYKNAKQKVIITCKIHGDFEQLSSNHFAGQGCPRCANNGTSSAEQELQDFIESLDVKIENNNRSILAGKELDIYIPSKNIAIEYDGLYWHSDKFRDKKYHLNKTEQCEKQNIQLIHIFEDEWCTQRQIVKNRLKSLLGKTKYSVFARKCEVREIDAKLKNKFLNKYHIQGEDKSKIKLGLFYKDRLVAVMTFGKSRFNKNVEWELIRYCTVANFRILGGAGKLLKHFERAYKPTSIISYADRRWSHGKVYKQLGFTHTHNSSPNYFYTDGHQSRESRHKFMKHKLNAKLKIFNPELSEVENMKLNSYYRIFDSGNMAFIKNY